MNDTIIIAVVLAVVGMLLVVAAIPFSAALVRLSARRLPTTLALRMEEEWLGELNSIKSRLGKLAFGVALILTRRRSFIAAGEETMRETATVFGSRKSLVILSTLAFAIAAYGASFLVPVKYESDALMISTERDDLGQKVMTSRSFLTSVVRFLNWKEDMVDDLRRNVTVTTEPLDEGRNTGSTFVVKYLGSDAASAQQATSAVMSRFMELGLRQRFDQSTAAQDFMKAQLQQLAVRVQKKGDELAQHQGKYGATAGGVIALDHELLVSSYKAWFAKVLDGEMTAGLHEGRFLILDGPQPGKEITPNRGGFAVLGAFAGLAIGSMAVFGLDFRRRRLLASQ
jgi:hypothetical protein